MTPAEGVAPGEHRAALRRYLSMAAVCAAVIVADQLTKSWAEHALAAGPRHIAGPVYLVLTLNSGAAFSLGAGATPVIEVVALVLVTGILWQSRRLARRGGGWLTMLGLGLLAGGALSNLGDRVVRGHHGAVVDFIQLVSWWPVFNVADAAVTIGTLALVVALARPASERAGAHGSPTPAVRGGSERATSETATGQ